MRSEGLLTTAQVAALFQVNVRTVQRWVREGKLVFVETPGGTRRYRESDVEAVLYRTHTVEEGV